MKVYNKRGNISLKEKAMVKELEKYVQTELENDPSFQFKPAENIEELQSYFNKYATSEAEIIEEVDFNKKTESTTKEAKKNTKADVSDISNKQIDPFNREEPIIRDYVLENNFAEDTAQINPQQTFEEPISFDESFEIPENQSDNQGTTKKIKPRQQAEEVESEPMNPEFSQMDSAKQRKQTKRFAKQIVEITASLLEFGYVWYASRNITEAKLIEYENEEGLDLSLLLDMPEGQRVSVRDFFAMQLGQISEEAKIDSEDREDLTDALTEVFLEKGIAPTPTQNLLLVTARVIGTKFLSAFALSKSNEAILGQLRSMQMGENEQQKTSTPPPNIKPTKTPTPVYEDDNTMFDNFSENNSPQSVNLGEGIEIMFPIEKTTE